MDVLAKYNYAISHYETLGGDNIAPYDLRTWATQRGLLQTAEPGTNGDNMDCTSYIPCIPHAIDMFFSVGLDAYWHSDTNNLCTSTNTCSFLSTPGLLQQIRRVSDAYPTMKPSEYFKDDLSENLSFLII